DNDSTDRTAEIAWEYDCEVVSYTERHQMASVRNAGAKAATGELIAFVDSDKSLFPENLFCEIYHNLSDEKIIGGGCDADVDLKNLETRFALGIWHTFAWVTGIGAGLFYLRRKDFIELGGFNEEYYAAEDVEFAFRLKKLAKARGQKFVNLKGPLTICCRKFGMLSRFGAAKRMLAVAIGRGKFKDQDAWRHFYYDVDKLR
ncbi:MAG: glycosyltransferase, partial [Planctomycetes bacterium]|nr:glycosyltransferase [Planctomycetota bacterium]